MRLIRLAAGALMALACLAAPMSGCATPSSTGGTAAAAGRAALERAQDDPQGLLADATAALERSRQAADEAAELQSLYHRLVAREAPFDSPDPSVDGDLQHAVALAVKLHDDWSLAALLIIRASPALHRPEREQSQQDFAQAGKLIDVHGFEDLRVRWHLAKSESLLHQGQRTEATFEAMAAHKLAMTMHSTVLAAGSLALTARACCVYPGAGKLDLQRGIEYTKGALALAEQGHYRGLRLVAHTGLGRSLMQLQRYGEALPHMESCLVLATELHDEAHAAYAMIGLASAQRGLGHPQAAIVWLDRAQALLGKSAGPPRALVFMLDLGRAHALAQMGQRKDSLAMLDAAAASLQKMPAMMGEAAVRFHEVAAEVHALAGDTAAAYDSMRQLRTEEKKAAELADQQLLERVQAESAIQLKDSENALLRAEQRQANTRRWVWTAVAALVALMLGTLALWHWLNSRQAREHAAHLQALAVEEGQRTLLLSQGKATLERLATIGQEIAAQLDEAALVRVLHGHAGAMMDSTSIYLWMPDPRNPREMVLRFGVEDDTPVPSMRIPLESPISMVARCARERQDILFEAEDDRPGPNHIPGTRPMPTSLFGPLMLNGRLLGVLSIQSDRFKAYDERERQIFRALCAYSAVALGNAAGARELVAAQGELAQEKMSNMLIHAGKMVTIGRLASGLVHEMAHPVGTITLLNDAAQVLLAEDRAQEATKLLKSVERETDRLQRLIQRLRDFARSDVPGVVEVDLQKVLADARALFMPRLRMDLVRYQESVGPARVMADPERLALVIANVVFNALDAMAGMDADLQRAIEVLSQTDEDSVRLTLRDHGPGFCDDALSRLFQPFFTTKPEGKGLGLGLALSAESMSSMNGRIEASNHPEGGASLTLVLRKAAAGNRAHALRH